MFQSGHSRYAMLVISDEIVPLLIVETSSSRNSEVPRLCKWSRDSSRTNVHSLHNKWMWLQKYHSNWITCLSLFAPHAHLVKSNWCFVGRLTSGTSADTVPSRVRTWVAVSSIGWLICPEATTELWCTVMQARYWMTTERQAFLLWSRTTGISHRIEFH